MGVVHGDDAHDRGDGGNDDDGADAAHDGHDHHGTDDDGDDANGDGGDAARVSMPRSLPLAVGIGTLDGDATDAGDDGTVAAVCCCCFCWRAVFPTTTYCDTQNLEDTGRPCCHMRSCLWCLLLSFLVVVVAVAVVVVAIDTEPNRYLAPLARK